MSSQTELFFFVCFLSKKLKEDKKKEEKESKRRGGSETGQKSTAALKGYLDNQLSKEINGKMALT